MLNNREALEILKKNGIKLNKIRKYKKLTQVEISKRTGLTQCIVSKIESGKTDYSITSYIKYLKALRK